MALNLVADVGGTNTRVALADGARIREDSVERFRNADHADLGAILSRYLDATGTAGPSGACIAAAGPVRDGVARMTNLDWVIDRDVVGGATGADTISVLNDLQAQGHALDDLPAESLHVVRPQPHHSPLAARLLIGIGTGFNAAPVFDTATGRYVPPSEAGHATLPVRDGHGRALLDWLAGREVFPSIEEVLSGRGVERLYDWHAERAGIARTRTAKDIMEVCGAGEDEIAGRAAASFMAVLGEVAGNLALTLLPFGGVYLTGGVARAFAPHLARGPFGEAFADKGRFTGFMGNFGVTVICDDFAALTGCASHVARLVENSTT